MRIITGLDELRKAEGETLGPSDWHEVTQKDIDTFAEVTGDHQWIHVDVERARDTLSLGPRFSERLLRLEGFAFGVNYGLEKVRFPAPMPVGGRVRMSVELVDVEDIPGGAQLKMRLTFEREGGEKPVCVAEALSRVYTAG